MAFLAFSMSVVALFAFFYFVMELIIRIGIFELELVLGIDIM